MKADLRYRAKKYSMTQKKAADFPKSEHACYLLGKHEDIPTANIEDYKKDDPNG